MAKKKPAKPKKIFSPFLLSVAVAAGWAALHSPAHFNPPGEAAAWAVSALAVALVTRAALAIISPLIKLVSDILRHLAGPGGADDRNDA